MRNLPHKVTGDDLTADEFNDIPEEEENLITSTGQALTAGDLYQIAKAVAMYSSVGDFYVDSGSANAYVLTAVSPLQAPHQYMDGMRVRFRISHTNTGSATINVNTLGVKAIVKEDGVSPLGEGDLPIGEHGELIFHADINSFELYSHKYQDQGFITGDNVWTDNSGFRAGWIWIDNSYFTTIGSVTSGANIRANADCENLFKLYWTYPDAECHVIGGRGVSAAADWTSNKQITIPDKFMRVFAVWDRQHIVHAGSIVGAATNALTDASFNAPHSHTYADPGHSHYVSDPSHVHTYSNNTGYYAVGGGSPPAAAGLIMSSNTGNNVTGVSLGTSPTAITISSSGSGSAFSIMQPTIYTNLYIKL